MNKRTLGVSLSVCEIENIESVYEEKGRTDTVYFKL